MALTKNQLAILKRYREKNREALRAKSRAYDETHREERRQKALARHWANRGAALLRMREHHAANRDSVLKRQKERYRNKRQEELARARLYRAANPEVIRANTAARRAKRKSVGGTYTAADIRRLFELQRGKCAVCRTELGGGFHRDHILPLRLGGRNSKDNIQLLCQPCNQAKYKKHPVDFMQERGFLL
jgi:5-methylcytosine-specific restriction endonuclease McrA